MARERVELWQERITQWQSSGLSGMAYCKQESLAYGRFIYWRKKLVGSPEPDGATPSGFARVAPVARLEAAAGLTVSLPGGVSITGLHAGNVDLLGAILRQL